MMGLFRKKSVAQPMLPIREIVVTTIYNRVRSMPMAAEMALSCAGEIGKRIESSAPVFSDYRALVDWLVAQIEREEFSLCEDVLDGSAA